MDDGSFAGLQLPSKSKSKIIIPEPIIEKPTDKTVHRDKFGRKIDLDLLQSQKDDLDKIKEDEKNERLRKGRGVKQKELQDEMDKKLIDEKISKFSNYKDDFELNEDLKDVERFDDPMAVNSFIYCS